MRPSFRSSCMWACSALLSISENFFCVGAALVLSLHLSLFPWALVFLLLSMEASWILFPTFQVVDHPLLYAFLGIFLIGLVGQFEEVSLYRVAVYLGLLFAAGYLIKMTMLAAGPAIGSFWLSFLWRRYRASEKISRRILIAPRELLSHAKLALFCWAVGRCCTRMVDKTVRGPNVFVPPQVFSESTSLTSDFSISVAQVIGEATLIMFGALNFLLPWFQPWLLSRASSGPESDGLCWPLSFSYCFTS